MIFSCTFMGSGSENSVWQFQHVLVSDGSILKNSVCFLDILRLEESTNKSCSGGMEPHLRNGYPPGNSHIPPL